MCVLVCYCFYPFVHLFCSCTDTNTDTDTDALACMHSHKHTVIQNMNSCGTHSLKWLHFIQRFVLSLGLYFAFFSLLLFLYLSFFLSQVCYASFSHLTALHENNAFVAMQLLVSRRDVIFVLLFFLLMNVLCLLRHERSDFFFKKNTFFRCYFVYVLIISFGYFFAFVHLLRNLIFFLFATPSNCISNPEKEQSRSFFFSIHIFSRLGSMMLLSSYCWCLMLLQCVCNFRWWSMHLLRLVSFHCTYTTTRKRKKEPNSLRRTHQTTIESNDDDELQKNTHTKQKEHF